jgi:heat shock protein HslJ
MNKEIKTRPQVKPKINSRCFRLLSFLVLSMLLIANGCSLWQGKAVKEMPCLVAPEHIEGLYGTRITTAGTPEKMIRLKLSPGHHSELITDSLDGKPALIENGQWECRHASTVTVLLTGSMGQAHEKPEVIDFTADGDSLSALQYDKEKWGNEGLRLERNPAVTGIVWWLAQIQYANNTALVPEDPSKYALILSQDGTVTVRADCNRGMGTYLMAGPWLVVRKLAYTHMICMGNSLFDPYTKALESISSCVFRDGNFYISLQTDSGVMKFVPAALGE